MDFPTDTKNYYFCQLLIRNYAKDFFTDNPIDDDDRLRTT